MIASLLSLEQTGACIALHFALYLLLCIREPESRERMEDWSAACTLFAIIVTNTHHVSSSKGSLSVLDSYYVQRQQRRISSFSKVAHNAFIDRRFLCLQCCKRGVSAFVAPCPPLLRGCVFRQSLSAEDVAFVVGKCITTSACGSL